MLDQTRTGSGTAVDQSLATALPTRMITQAGIALKNKQGKLMVHFQTPFTETPTVIVTPYWKNRASAASFPETLDTVTREGFVVASNNAAPDYYVSWLAHGPVETPFLVRDDGGGGMSGGGGATGEGENPEGNRYRGGD